MPCIGQAVLEDRQEKTCSNIGFTCSLLFLDFYVDILKAPLFCKCYHDALPILKNLAPPEMNRCFHSGSSTWMRTVDVKPRLAANLSSAGQKIILCLGLKPHPCCCDFVLLALLRFGCKTRGKPMANLQLFFGGITCLGRI